jgi:hypothetical protein
VREAVLQPLAIQQALGLPPTAIVPRRTTHYGRAPYPLVRDVRTSRAHVNDGYRRPTFIAGPADHTATSNGQFSNTYSAEPQLILLLGTLAVPCQADSITPPEPPEPNWPQELDARCMPEDQGPIYGVVRTEPDTSFTWLRRDPCGPVWAKSPPARSKLATS